jgi:ribosomal protein L32
MNEVSRDVLVLCIVPRLHSVRDLVHLASASKLMRRRLLTSVELARVQNDHVKWTRLYFRRQKSWLQAWCDKLERSSVHGDNDTDRWSQRMNDSRFRLHYWLTQQMYQQCRECGESIRKHDVDCFVDWIHTDCLCCARSTEYDFIDSGSADEEEMDNQVQFILNTRAK